MNVQRVTYQLPVIERKVLGHKPANVLLENEAVSKDYVKIGDYSPQGATSKVWGSVPQKNADGTPRLRSVEADLDLTPRSPWKYGLIAGALGAAAGAVFGLAGAATLGLSQGLTALSAGAGVGLLAGGGAALAVRGEKVQVVWDTHTIQEPKYLGFHHYVGPGEKDGQRGFFHRYVPDVQENVIGEYQVPRTVRFKGEILS